MDLEFISWRYVDLPERSPNVIFSQNPAIRPCRAIPLEPLTKVARESCTKEKLQAVGIVSRGWSSDYGGTSSPPATPQNRVPQNGRWGLAKKAMLQNPPILTLAGVWLSRPSLYTGCIKKLFPLCVLYISQLSFLLKIKFIRFLKSPFSGQIKNVKNFIARWKIHREIHQDIHQIWNKN